MTSEPREWQIRICPKCGREQLQGEVGAGICWHIRDGITYGQPMDRVYVREVESVSEGGHP